MIPWSTLTGISAVRYASLVFVAECRHAGSGSGGSSRWVNPAPAGTGFRNEDPYESIVLFAGVAPGIDAIDLQLLICRQRRDQLALAGVRLELPSVITAFDLLSVEPPQESGMPRCGHASRRAKARPSRSRPRTRGSLQQHRLRHAVALETVPRARLDTRTRTA